MFTVDTGFIGEFKTGDNINYNLEILRALYAVQGATNPKEVQLYCKPITIILAAIVEALLHDLFSRMKYHTKEGVQNISVEVLQDAQEKTRDKFEAYIAGAKKYDLFGETVEIYEQMDFLRKVRNRLHIQNMNRQLEADEKDVFTQSRQMEAEKVLESVVKLVSTKYLRPSNLQGYVEPFGFPWKEHLSP